MRRKLLLGASIAILFAACSKVDTTVTPSAANFNSEASAKKDSEGKPFKGALTLTIDMENDLSCDCGNFASAGTYSGSGNLSHLGNSKAYIKPCIAPIFSGNALVGYHVGVQCGYFVAANGDIVNCDVQPYDLMFTATGGVGNVTVKFAGGTGRFKNAKGTFTGYTTNDGMGNVTFTNINGKIDY